MKFPTTTEAFATDQAQRMGIDPLELDSDLKEAMSALIPLFNACFEDGKRRDVKALMEHLKLIDGFRSPEDSAFLTHWIDASRRWLIVAWQQGAAVQ